MNVRFDELTPELTNELIISRIPAGRFSKLNLKPGSDDLVELASQLIKHCCLLVAGPASGTGDRKLRLHIRNSDDDIAAALSAFDLERISHDKPSEKPTLKILYA